MSIQLSDYRHQSFEALVEQAYDNGLDNAGQFSVSELIFEMVCADVQRNGNRVEIVADGLLEILSDGFGFLRSPVSGFAAGADDIYVSPAQIRRFNLQTGDWIQGLVRIPRDNERYFALLRIEEVNGRSPEMERKRLTFDSQSVGLEPDVCADSPLDGVNLGETVLLRLGARQHPSAMLFSMLKSMGSVVLTLLNYSKEDVEVVKRAWPKGLDEGRLLYSVRGADANRHLQVLNMGLRRGKRLVEQCQDVHWVVLNANSVAVATQFSMEQSATAGAESLGVERVCKTLSEARDLEASGSLTIWMGAHVGRTAYEDAVIQRIDFEVDHRCTIHSDGTLIAIDE